VNALCMLTINYKRNFAAEGRALCNRQVSV
jgi:hypothetical protein